VLRLALVAEFRAHLEFSLANRAPLAHDAGARDMCARAQPACAAVLPGWVGR